MDFWDIYYDYYERVKRFIFALVKDEWVADDLVQETFIKVQKNLNQLRDHSKLSSWIFRKECRFEVDERNVLICDPITRKD